MSNNEYSPPWQECPTLSVDLNLPPSERFQSNIEEMRRVSSDLLEAVFSEINSVAPQAIQLAHLINMRSCGRYFRESRAFAKAVNADWKRIMVAGMAYELMALACSTVALATDSGPVLARNMDFWPEHALARNTYKLLNQRNGETVSSVAGWPGAPGVVTGMSNKGFAIALNAVWSSEGLRKTGYPVLLTLREVIDHAKDYQHAVEILKTRKLMAACLLTVVGTKNEERIVIERTPTKAQTRHPQDDEALVTTNDFRTNIDSGFTKNEHELHQTSCGRFDAMTAYCQMPESQNPSDEMLLYALSDDCIIQGITAQHVIMRPSKNVMSVYVPKRLLNS